MPHHDGVEEELCHSLAVLRFQCLHLDPLRQVATTTNLYPSVVVVNGPMRSIPTRSNGFEMGMEVRIHNLIPISVSLGRSDIA